MCIRDRSLTSILITTIPRQKIEAHEVRHRYSNDLHVQSVFLVFVGKAYVITTANSVHKLQRMPSMKDKPTVVLLEDVRIEDVPAVGGKEASLGEMINAEIPVPRGFAVTAQAFRRFLDGTDIAKQLFATLQVNVDDAKELAAAAEKAKKLILATKMPQHMRNDIITAYKELGKREGKEPLVAVRSSATAEDMPEASFAGQQETFLNIKGCLLYTSP